MLGEGRFFGDEEIVRGLEKRTANVSATSDTAVIYEIQKDFFLSQLRFHQTYEIFTEQSSRNHQKLEQRIQVIQKTVTRSDEKNSKTDRSEEEPPRNSPAQLSRPSPQN